jgi:membrane-associated protease RseP (regulator of RpoE activity)
MNKTTHLLLFLFILSGLFIFTQSHAVAATSDRPDSIASDNQKDKAWLGVMISDLNREKRKSLETSALHGAVINDILKDSPAAGAGLEENDIIIKLDDKTVRNSRDLTAMLGKKHPGETVVLGYVRGKDKNQVEVKLGSRPYRQHPFLDNKRWIGNFYSRGPSLGLELQEMDENLAPYFSVKPQEGLLVTEVDEDGPADKAGIHSGDVLMELAGVKVAQVSDVEDILSDLEGKEVEAVYSRKGAKQKVKITLEEKPGRFFKYHFDSHAIPRSLPLEIYMAPEIQKDIQRNLSSEMDDFKEQMKDWKNFYKDEMKERIKREVDESMRQLQKNMENLQKEMDSLKEELDAVKQKGL